MMISILVRSCLFAVLSTTLQACSIAPGDAIGPFFQFFPGVINDSPFLWSTPSDSSILLGTISGYNTTLISSTNVTISLTDGSVSAGWPADAELTVPPATLEDPTAGVEVIVSADGSSVTLVVEGDIAYNLDLEVPEYYSGVHDPENRVFFFVDDQIAYFFYAGLFDCAIPAAAAAESECANCPECTFTENYFSAAINLRTAEVIHTGTQFTSQYGLDVFSPGPMNSVETVYPELQIANVGALDSCGGTGYLMYNANGTVTQLLRFDPGNLYAAAAGEEYVAYAMHQNEKFAETRYVESFEVRKFSMITGETISTIPIDTDTLWSLVGMEMPSMEVAEPTMTPVSPNIPIVPITIRVPTLSPRITPAPIDGGFISTTTAPTSAAPSTSIPSTLAPSESTTTLQPVESIPQVTVNDTVTGVPTATPTPMPSSIATLEPIVNSDNSSATFPPKMIFPQCSSNAACAELALSGDCCPTIQSVMLECCEMGTIELNCPANPRCAAEILEGACCPTSDGVYLDCCEVVPDDCGAESTDCVIMKVADYKAMRSGASGASLVLAAIWSFAVALKYTI